VTVQRVLRDTQAQPEVTFYVGTTPTDADGAVTVDITRGDGSVFLSDQATTLQGAASGTYRYTLAPQSALELFTFRWEGTFGGVMQHITSQVEIVGGYYVSLVDIRAENSLSNTTKFPNAKLAEARQWFEDKAERFCGVSFVPHYQRDVLNGRGSTKLELRRARPRVLLSVKFDGVAQTTTDWDLYDAGYIVAPSAFPVGARNVEVIYEHGFDSPDSDMREAALTAIRARLLGDQSAIPANISQMQVDGMTQTFRAPTRPTGIGEVDAVLLDRQVPMVALS
jgi:hypothetical protein